MIKSFASSGTEDVWVGDDTKAARKLLTKELWESARDLLDQLDSAVSVGDMRLPPSNKLHKLKGDRKEFWAVWINTQYRIVFRFDGGNAFEVEIEDYH